MSPCGTLIVKADPRSLPLFTGRIWDDAAAIRFILSSRFATGSPLNFSTAAAAFSTVDEISRASAASPAAVVRFANTLEFSGFSDFQNALQSQIENQMRLYSRLKERFPYLNSRVDPASMIFKTETLIRAKGNCIYYGSAGTFIESGNRII